MKILMVCLGNICRSPLAQGILENKLSNNFFVDSAGTAAYHIGNKPDKRSISVAKKYNIDISNQRARQFNTSDFDTFDLIFAMDKQNYRDILSLARTEVDKAKVKLILQFLPNTKMEEVPDPYYGEKDGFEFVYQFLDNACDKIVETYLKKEAF